MRKVRAEWVEILQKKKYENSIIFEKSKIKELVDSGLSLSKAAKVAGIKYEKAKSLYLWAVEQEDIE